MIEKLGIAPGPWKWHGRHNTTIDCANGEVLTSFVNGSVYRENAREDQDTARFVATAPAMLEALVELLCNCDDECFRLPKDDTDKWRGIIESATGKKWEEIKDIME